MSLRFWIPIAMTAASAAAWPGAASGATQDTSWAYPAFTLPELGGAYAGVDHLIDLDGDGVVDGVGAGGQSSSSPDRFDAGLDLFRGTGTGFEHMASFDLGTIEGADYVLNRLVVGDFDGDGVGDLSCLFSEPFALEPHHGLQVLLGTGPWSYTASDRVDLDDEPVEGVAVRIPGADRDELLINTRRDGIVRYRLNSGTGLFEEVWRGFVEGYNEAMALGQMTGDSAPELVRATPTDVFVHEMLPDGSFDPAPWGGVTISDASPLVAADMDLDGDDDVVFTQYFGDFGVLRNAGNGLFEVIPYAPGLYGNWDFAEVADYDANGLPDILVSDRNGQVFERRHWAAMNPLSAIAEDRALVRLPTGGGEARVYDLFADGRPDVLLTRYPPGVVWNRGGDDRLALFGPRPTDSSNNGLHVLMRDFNADGREDAVISASGGGVSVMLADGRGELVLSQEFEAEGSGFLSVPIDFDDDGQRDFAAVSRFEGVNVYRNIGAGQFEPAQTVPIGDDDDLYGIARADVDADGDPDLVVTNYDTGELVVVINEGGVFVEGAHTALGGTPFMVATGRVDADPLADAVVLDREAKLLHVLLNSAGGFVLDRSIAVEHEPYWVEMADVNGDGHRDVVIACYDYPGTIETRLGDGAGGLSGPIVSGAGTAPFIEVNLRDYDGDGVLDAIATAKSNPSDFPYPPSLSLLRGVGDGSFVETQAIPMGDVKGASFGDCTGDGRADIVAVIESGGDDVMVFDQVTVAPPCAADLDANGVLNVDDIGAFAALFLAGDLAVDLDGNGVLNVDDIGAFVSAFLGGCP